MQIHSYTNTQIHKYANTQLHKSWWQIPGNNTRDNTFSCVFNSWHKLEVSLDNLERSRGIIRNDNKWRRCVDDKRGNQDLWQDWSNQLHGWVVCPCVRTHPVAANIEDHENTQWMKNWEFFWVPVMNIPSIFLATRWVMSVEQPWNSLARTVFSEVLIFLYHIQQAAQRMEESCYM